jgi:hypothetical protein
MAADPMTVRDAEEMLSRSEYVGFRIRKVGPKGDHTMIGANTSEREDLEEIDVWPIEVAEQKEHVTRTFRHRHPKWWPLFNNFLIRGGNKVIVRYTA